jgi:hypothetical protein
MTSIHSKEEKVLGFLCFEKKKRLVWTSFNINVRTGCATGLLGNVKIVERKTASLSYCYKNS